MRDDHLAQLLHSLDHIAEPDAVFADDLFARLSSTAAARARGRSRTPFLLLAATLMLVALGGGMALGSGLIKLPGLSREPLPAPSASATATSLPSASVQATVSAAVNSTPSPIPAATLASDQIVHSTVDGLEVRRSTGIDGERLGSMAAGMEAFVVGGPREVDGYNWYKLSGLGLPPSSGCVSAEQTDPFECPVWGGWVAAGDKDGTPWLEPSSPDCPPSPMNLEDLGPGRSDLQRLACYGNQTITFRGWWPKLPQDAGLGGLCEVSDPTPRWLVCQNINYNLLDPSPSGDGLGLLRISINPATGVTMPERGQWVEVTAHLDDPAAEQCYDAGANYPPDVDPGERVLDCRGQLAVESVKVVDGIY